MRLVHVKVGGCLLFLMGFAIIVGQIFRSEVSPWFWEQYGVRALRHGTVDALLEMGFYLIFYLGGFVIPYLLTSGLLSVWFDSKKYGETTAIDRNGLRGSKLVLSFGCLLSLVLFLDSEIAFVHNLPTDIWNGWLLILVSGASIFFIFAGIRGIWEELAKTRISVSPSADIVCRCPRCGHDWSFPSERLRTHNIVFQR